MGRVIRMDHMEGEVLVREKAKDSSTIVVSGGSDMKNGQDYELAMVNLEMYYSFTNN